MVDEVAELDPQEDRRADLEAAMEGMEFDDDDSTTTVSESPDTPSVSPAGEEPVSEQAAPNLDKDGQPDNQQTQQTRKPKPPVDYPQELKDQFQNLPEGVQNYMHKRDVDVSKLMQQTADARRTAEGLIRTVEPYRALMVAEGVSDPLQAIDGLLKTAAVLSMGSPQQKVDRMVQLINHYGLMDHIELLDKGLSGQRPQESEQDRINRMVQQGIAPVLSRFEQADRQQQQEMLHRADQMVAEMRQQPEFSLMEAETGGYYQDGSPVLIRHLMADIIDTREENGWPKLPIEQIYRQACVSVPNIEQQFIQRQQSGFMQNQQQRVDQKRNAASSIVGRASNGAGNPSALGEMSIRDALAAQMGGGGRI